MGTSKIETFVKTASIIFSSYMLVLTVLVLFMH